MARRRMFITLPALLCLSACVSASDDPLLFADCTLTDEPSATTLHLRLRRTYPEDPRAACWKDDSFDGQSCLIYEGIRGDHALFTEEHDELTISADNVGVYRTFYPDEPQRTYRGSCTRGPLLQ
ncbi:hypothetical protein [Frigidibacter sp. ROC022]|uniref:hypothetical protein n=1 Tax=Frigidibacter sp. ROC022 TaxID=2971796 RepID=UPI00215B675B|nr:hypothetical protein [Frigidibacter sp. ROC022]MCR8723872.1 hypothetical protein [Frigidibacter sp. ROC022]